MHGAHVIECAGIVECELKCERHVLHAAVKKTVGLGYRVKIPEPGPDDSITGSNGAGVCPLARYGRRNAEEVIAHFDVDCVGIERRHEQCEKQTERETVHANLRIDNQAARSRLPLRRRHKPPRGPRNLAEKKPQIYVPQTSVACKETRKASQQADNFNRPSLRGRSGMPNSLARASERKLRSRGRTSATCGSSRRPARRKWEPRSRCNGRSRRVARPRRRRRCSVAEKSAGRATAAAGTRAARAAAPPD